MKISDTQVKSTTNDSKNSSERRRLLKTLTAGGAVATVTTWHKPIIDAVVLPAHAQTSDPVALSVTAAADTDSGLVVRAAASSAATAAPEPTKIDVELQISQEDREFNVAEKITLETNKKGVAQHTFDVAKHDALAGDRYLLKVVPKTAVAVKTTTLRGLVKAATDFALKAEAVEISQTAVKATIVLSEAVRNTQWVRANLAVRDVKGTLLGTKALSLAAKTEGKTAVASLNLTEADLAAAAIKMPEAGSITLSANMARSDIFGAASLKATKEFKAAIKKPVTEPVPEPVPVPRPVAEPVPVPRPVTRPVTTTTEGSSGAAVRR